MLAQSWRRSTVAGIAALDGTQASYGTRDNSRAVLVERLRLPLMELAHSVSMLLA
jgi:hypothetical protein